MGISFDLKASSTQIKLSAHVKLEGVKIAKFVSSKITDEVEKE